MESLEMYYVRTCIISVVSLNVDVQKIIMDLILNSNMNARDDE